MTYQQQAARASEIMKAGGAVCDCAWNTGDHAMECAIESAWANAMEQAEDEAHQAE